MALELTPEVIKALPDPFMVVSIMKNARKAINPDRLMKKHLGYGDETMEKLYGLAFSLYEKGKFQEAEELFEELFYLDPTDYRISYGTAAAAQQLGDWYKAISYYTSAAVSDPKAPEPLYFSGECCLQMGKEKEAIKFYKDAAAICPDKGHYKELKERCLVLADSLEKRLQENKPPLCLEARKTNKTAS